LRKSYMDKINEYPLWYRKFMLENPLYESARPSHFKYDSQLGMTVLDLDSKEYNQAMEGLAPKEPAAPAPTQLELPINDDVRKRTNHYTN